MALISINSRDAIEGHISIPRVGIWHADFFVDGPDAIGPAVTITFGDGTKFQATVIRQATYANYVRFRAVAGSGRLYKTRTTPKQWSGTPIPLSVPLKAILAESGDALSSKSDQSVLNTQLPGWTLLPQSCPAAIKSLVDPYADAWRTLPDGTLWVGGEAWKEVDGTFNYTLLHQRTDLGVMEIAEDTSSLRPGNTFRGFRVSRVDNFLTQKHFRTLVHYFDAPT